MKIILLICLSAALLNHGESVLKLPAYFGDHMVLQRGPRHAVIWGTADTEGDTVTVKVTGEGVTVAPVTTKVIKGEWKVKLPAVTSTVPFVINISSADGHVNLNDVLFGDVWLCGGQSNMGFSMSQVINSTQEIQHALQFKNIRIIKASNVESPTPKKDITISTKWTAPTTNDLKGFSAVCWLFGEYLYPHLNYPLGMVESCWGGTPIEAWSPPEAISACANVTKRAPGDKTVLWNAMINPIVSSTLYGAIWYQGEANAGRYTKYGCQIQAMVNQWRTIFNKNSLSETSNKFPFGYVQLAGNNPGPGVGSFPGERWAQTHNYGYSPNPALPETFMAVAMDLPDYHSPYGTIHPRYKQDVAHRLVLGALNVAYGQKSVVHQGPFPTGFQADAAQHTLTITYDSGNSSLQIRTGNNTGFEVCCSLTNGTRCNDGHDQWVAAPITKHDTSHVTVSTNKCLARPVVGLRYEWRTSPCDYKECTLYDSRTTLPAPPYITLTIPTA